MQPVRYCYRSPSKLTKGERSANRKRSMTEMIELSDMVIETMRNMLSVFQDKHPHDEKGKIFKGLHRNSND